MFFRVMSAVDLYNNLFYDIINNSIRKKMEHNKKFDNYNKQDRNLEVRRKYQLNRKHHRGRKVIGNLKRVCECV